MLKAESPQLVAFLDLKAQYQNIQDEIEAAVLEVLRSGIYVLGPNVTAFEKEAQEFLQTKHAITCANGTDALHIALRCLGIGSGDEVITTSFTFIASASTISLTGAKPVFADIDINSYNIDPAQIEKLITKRTKAIVVVHLYGQAAAISEIMNIARKHKLKVIEDTAQAFGTKYRYNGVPTAPLDDAFAGTIGDIGTYSFYPTKNLSCAGDGGMLTTNDDEIAERLRALRVHGSKQRYYHDELGFNSRLDEIQAAILRIKLKYINSWNQARRDIAVKYNEKLSGTEFEGAQIITPSLTENSTHVYHQYTIRFEKSGASVGELEKTRDNFKNKLKENNISSEIYYPLPLHMQKAFADLNYKAEDFPETLKAAKSILCLPIYPELDYSSLVNAISLQLL